MWQSTKLWVLFLVLEVFCTIQSVQSNGQGAHQISDEARQKFREAYEGCDAKGCMGIDRQCVDRYHATKDNPVPEVCGAFVTWKKEGERNVFQLVGIPVSTTRGYIAFGLSDDNRMGQDSIVGCWIQSNGQATASRFYNNPSYANEPVDNLNLGLTVKSASLIEGYLFCDFEQTDHTWKDINVDFKNSYHFLLARGSSSTNRLEVHDGGKVASDEKLSMIDRISDEVKQKFREAYEGCDAKGCMGIDRQCVDRYHATKDNPVPEVCGAFVTWKKEGERNVFQLVGIPGSTARGYIALGLSDDDKMGKDSVVGCWIQSNGQATASRFYNNPSYANEPVDNPNLSLTVTSASLIERYLFCDFEQTDHTWKDINVDFKNSYHFLLARGSSSTNRLEVHDGGKVASDEKLSMTDGGIVVPTTTTTTTTQNVDTTTKVDNSSPVLHRFHGSIMIIASTWLLLCLLH